MNVCTNLRNKEAGVKNSEKLYTKESEVLKSRQRSTCFRERRYKKEKGDI